MNSFRSDLSAPAIVRPEGLMRAPRWLPTWRRPAFSIVPVERLMKTRAETPTMIIRNGQAIPWAPKPLSLDDWFAADVRYLFWVKP